MTRNAAIDQAYTVANRIETGNAIFWILVSAIFTICNPSGVFQEFDSLHTFVNVLPVVLLFASAGWYFTASALDVVAEKVEIYYMRKANN